MTVRSLIREFVVAYERMIDERNKELSLAWHIEMFARQKQLPDLKDVQVKPKIGREDQFTQTMANLSILTGRDPQRVRLVKREAVVNVG